MLFICSLFSFSSFPVCFWIIETFCDSILYAHLAYNLYIVYILVVHIEYTVYHFNHSLSSNNIIPLHMYCNNITVYLQFLPLIFSVMLSYIFLLYIICKYNILLLFLVFKFLLELFKIRKRFFGRNLILTIIRCPCVAPSSSLVSFLLPEELPFIFFPLGLLVMNLHSFGIKCFHLIVFFSLTVSQVSKRSKWWVMWGKIRNTTELELSSNQFPQTSCHHSLCPQFPIYLMKN